MLTVSTANEWMPALVVDKFDVWARRGVQVVWTADAVQQYDAWLIAYANAWIESVFQLLASHPPPFPPELALTDLRSRLAARVHHWKAEARASARGARRHPPRQALRRRPSRDLVKRRRRAVQKHRDDHDLDAVGFARRVGISEYGGHRHHQGGPKAFQPGHAEQTAGRHRHDAERNGTENGDRFSLVLLPIFSRSSPVFSRSCRRPSRVHRRSAGAAPRWLARTRATESCCPCPPAGGSSDTSATACPTPRCCDSAISSTPSLNVRSPAYAEDAADEHRGDGPRLSRARSRARRSRSAPPSSSSTRTFREDWLRRAAVAARVTATKKGR